MSHDTLLHRAVRPLVRPLASTATHPNHLTLLRIATAMAASGCFATGRSGPVGYGAVLFVLSALLDRADGELARLTRRFSAWGHRLDLLADCGADAMALFAIGIGASRGALGGWALVLGATAAGGTAWLFWQLNRPGNAVLAPPGRRLIDPDDLMLAVPVLAWLFGLPLVVVLAGLVTPIVAVVVAARQERRLRRGGRQRA